MLKRMTKIKLANYKENAQDCMGKENKMILFESFLSAVFRSSIYIAWLIKNNEDISSMCISITHYLF